MNFSFVKKIISGVLIVTLILPSFLIPQKAEAVLGVGDVVTDPGNTVQNTITAANSVVSSASTYSLQLKEFVLDGLLNVLVKQVIRQMTQSVVNWINSGFEGSPSFLQNPGAFFLDVADQVTGAFLAKYGGPLTALCSPFSLDIQIALRFKYHPNVMKRYTCTLNTIIKNSKNAVENASINGFTAGDFKQGGWPAFVSLSTEPQNNVYGAYLQAEADLSWRVASARSQQKEEISQGKGFLSWKKCKDDGSEEALYAKKDLEKTEKGSEEEFYAKQEVNKHQTCEVQTPGSVISSSLENQLGSGLRQLELADEINEIVNALVAQLITQVLTKGLGSVSGSGPGDSNSYINNLNNGDGSSSQLETLRTQVLNTVENPLKLTTDYVDLKKQSYEIYNTIDNDYKDASACFNALLTSPNRPYWDLSEYSARLNEVKAAILKITPTRDSLKTQFEEAQKRLTTMREIRSTANTARTLEELNVASQKLSQLSTTMSLTNAKDIQDARTQLDETRISAGPYINDSKTQLGRCRNSQ